MGSELGKFAEDDFTVEDIPYGTPEDEAFVSLRYVSVEKARELYNKATKLGFDSARQPTHKTDEDKFARLWGEWAVVGWRGFLYGGEEYPFTPENRDKAMSGQRKFKAWVMQMADDIQALTQAEREKIRGN